MNLQQLRYITEVERAGSISKAAKNLFMGQPNLSRAIRELEEETGVTIFRRTSYGVELTDAGSRFLTYAHAIISQMDELESLYRRPKNGKEKLTTPYRFSISVSPTACAFHAFCDLLSALPKEGNVPVDVRFRETSALSAIHDVASGEAQIALIRCAANHQSYYADTISSLHMVWEPVWTFHACLFLHDSHPLSQYQEIHYHMLDGFTEVRYGDLPTALSFSEINREARMRQEKRCVRVYERGGGLSLLQLIPGAYMWEAPVPPSILKPYCLVRKECRMGEEMKDMLVYRQDHHMTKEEEQFLNAFQKYTVSPSAKK